MQDSKRKRSGPVEYHVWCFIDLQAGAALEAAQTTCNSTPGALSLSLSLLRTVVSAGFEFRGVGQATWGSGLGGLGGLGALL